MSLEMGVKRREYTEAERKVRGLDQWRDDPEMFIADLNARIKALEAAVAQLQLHHLVEKNH